MFITTKEIKDQSGKVSTIIESVEQIKQNSSGFAQGLELLSNFETDDNKRMVFIFSRLIPKK
jgi:hypothetical protein